MTIEKQIGQMLIAGFKGLKIKQSDSIVRDIIKYNICGVILYDEEVSDSNERWRNIQTPEQTKELINSLQDFGNNNLLISIDQEGGHVNRLKEEYGFPPCPSWGGIGSFIDINKTRDFSENLAATLNNSRFNLNFAPVVDVETNGESYISKLGRCFGSDPNNVAEHAYIFITAHKKHGVATTLKHFPGLGSAIGDTHDGFTDITSTWSEIELDPYKLLFESCDVDMVMVGHSFHKGIDPDWPASMSYKTVTELLRNKLGYNGVVICDDPSMGAISKNYPLEVVMEKMINAGVDLLCFGNNLFYDPEIISKAVKTIYSLVNKRRISKTQINDSFQRIQKLKAKIKA